MTDLKDLELLLQESAEREKTLQQSLDQLIEVSIKGFDRIEPPVSEVKVQGTVSVDNQSDVVQVENLDELKTAIEENLAEQTERLEKRLAKLGIDKVEVSNIKEAINKEVKIVNLKPIIEAINKIDVRPEVKVETKEMALPTTANKPLAVRLSDGKSFYNAIMSAVSQAGSQDPTAGYSPSDKDTSTSTKYYGFVNKNGAWYIMRDNGTTYRYAKGIPQPRGGGLYTDAWTNRANLDYKYFYEVF